MTGEKDFSVTLTTLVTLAAPASYCEPGLIQDDYRGLINYVVRSPERGIQLCVTLLLHQFINLLTCLVPDKHYGTHKDVL